MYKRIDDQQLDADADGDSSAPSILTSALRRALSPNHASGSSLSLAVSDEEIWSAKPAAADRRADSPRDRRRTCACHPGVWAWNNRWLLAAAAATVAAAAAVVALAPHGLPLLKAAAADARQPAVVLVSLDGLREEYLARGLTPNLAALAASGISASYLTPSFPSLTFPNHYSIVTGLYPESHGIVANVFYDSKLNDTFVYVDNAKNQESKWWGGEPLWVTAVKNGLKSATMMWPGSEAPIHNTRPTYYQPYNGSMSNSDRVSQIISWISLPIESRPAFLTLYISDIDTAGHKYGPNSPQVNAALKAVDSNIGTLIEGVMKAQSATSLQASNVNIVVVSDHGMAPGNPVDGFIYLDDIVDEKLFTMVNNVVCFIYPKDPSKTTSILEALQKASLESTHWNVWARDEVPDTFHFSKNNDRIGPIVALPKQGYALALRSVISAKLNASQPVTLGGMHGYNNSNVDMRAIFIAAGPAFKSSERVLGTTSNSTEAVAVWEVDGGQLDVDTEGHIVVALHGGAAVGGELGIHQRDFEYIKSGGLKRDGDAASSTLVVSPLQSTTSSLPSLSASSSAATSSNIASQVTPPVHSAQASSESAAPNGTFIALQMIPHFENVEIYNLILRVLKLSGRGSANNGTKAGMDLFEPWLNY